MHQAGDGGCEDRPGFEFHNLIEPRSLVNQFLRCPPYGFRTLEIGGTTPAFVADFDLTTTMEPKPRRGRMASTLWRFAGRLLRFRTCFVGTTVTEYAPLPQGQAPADFVHQLLQRAPDFTLLIVKDIPAAPALVSEAAFQHSGELVEACLKAGFLMVEGQALAYVPMDFASTDAFLARMTPSRRKDVRRKLRSAQQLEIQTIPTGAERFADEAVLGEFYALYRNVYAQSEIHFDLLSPDFFRAVLQDAASGGVVFEYRAAGKLIGYNLCFVHRGMLLDKYVGFAYPQAREFNLYFVSWFHNLEYALERGLKCYVAGWTDPEIKRHLGASFTFTRHAVYIRYPWLRCLLSHFKHHFEADSRWRHQTR